MLWMTKQINWITLIAAAAAAAKLLQLCPTLCDPIDGSPPGSPVPGILQARTLEWVAISFSNAWKWKVKMKSLSRVRLLATPWTADYQAPPSLGFSRQEYWSGLPFPSPWITATCCYLLSNRLVILKALIVSISAFYLVRLKEWTKWLIRLSFNFYLSIICLHSFLHLKQSLSFPS